MEVNMHRALCQYIILLLAEEKGAGLLFTYWLSKGQQSSLCQIT